MSHCVSHLIGIRTGGVFSDRTDMSDFTGRVYALLKNMNVEDGEYPVPIENLMHCMSHELNGRKGTYVVIAGVFNYWTWSTAQEFSRLLSQEFGTETMHMCWDEETDEVNCQIFLDGKPLYDIPENPLAKTIRRIVG